MKLAHFPAALASPGFVLRNGLHMLRETFRGSSVRSCLGLTDDRAAFERYRRLRRAERAAIWVDLEDAAGGVPSQETAA